MDLYQDFAYAKLTEPVGAGDTVLTVDGTSHFPSNELLGKMDFWLSFDADPSNGSFEIVKLVSTTTNTITVSRGVSPLSHNSGIYVRGVLTAAQMQRARHAFTIEMSLPAPDPDIYSDGDAVYVVGDNLYGLVDGQWRALMAYRRYVDLGNLSLEGTAAITALLNLEAKLLSAEAGGSSVVSALGVLTRFQIGMLGDAHVTATQFEVARGAVSTAVGVATLAAHLVETYGLVGETQGDAIAQSTLGTLVDYAPMETPGGSFSDDFSSYSPGSTLAGQNGWVGPQSLGQQAQVNSDGTVGFGNTSNGDLLTHDIGAGLNVEIKTHFVGPDTYKVMAFGWDSGQTTGMYVVANNSSCYCQSSTGPQHSFGNAISGTGVLRATIDLSGNVAVYFAQDGSGESLVGTYSMTTAELASISGTFAGFNDYNQKISEFSGKVAAEGGVATAGAVLNALDLNQMSAGPEITPPVSGALLWMDFDQLTESDGSTLGSTITSKEGNSYTASSARDGDGFPITVRRNVNGHVALEFPSASLHNGAALHGIFDPNFGNDFTIIQVFNTFTLYSGDDYYGSAGDLFNMETPGSENDMGTAIGSSSFLGGTGGPDRMAEATTALSTNTWHVATMDRVAATGEFRTFIDDPTTVSASNSGETATLNYSGGNWYVGAANEQQYGWEAPYYGQYMALLVFDSVLSDDDRAAVMNWATAYYINQDAVEGGSATVEGNLGVTVDVGLDGTPGASDNFNRADAGTPGDSWTLAGPSTASIVDNQLSIAPTGGFFSMLQTVGSYDRRVKATLISDSDTGSYGFSLVLAGQIGGGYNGCSNGYFANVCPSSQRIEVFRDQDSISFTSGDQHYSLPAGWFDTSHEIAMQMESGTLSLIVDGVVVETYVDSSPRTGTDDGFAVFLANGGTAVWDDWSSKPLSGAAATVSGTLRYGGQTDTFASSGALASPWTLQTSGADWEQDATGAYLSSSSTSQNIAALDTGLTDLTVSTVAEVQSSGGVNFGVVGRVSDDNNYLLLDVGYNTDNAAGSAALFYRQGGGFTVITTVDLPDAMHGDTITATMDIHGDTVYATIRSSAGWTETMSGTQSNITSGTYAGIRAYVSAGDGSSDAGTRFTDFYWTEGYGQPGDVQDFSIYKDGLVGAPWTQPISGSPNPTAWNVTAGSLGQPIHSGGSILVQDTAQSDGTWLADVTTAASGGLFDTGVVARVVDDDNYVFASFSHDYTNNTVLRVWEVIGGTFNKVAGDADFSSTHFSDTATIALTLSGSSVSATVITATDESETVSGTLSSPTTATDAGVWLNVSGNAPPLSDTGSTYQSFRWAQAYPTYVYRSTNKDYVATVPAGVMVGWDSGTDNNDGYVLDGTGLYPSGFVNNQPGASGSFGGNTWSTVLTAGSHDLHLVSSQGTNGGVLVIVPGTSAVPSSDSYWTDGESVTVTTAAAGDVLLAFVSALGAPDAIPVMDVSHDWSLLASFKTDDGLKRIAVFTAEANGGSETVTVSTGGTDTLLNVTRVA